MQTKGGPNFADVICTLPLGYLISSARPCLQNSRHLRRTFLVTHPRIHILDLIVLYMYRVTILLGNNLLLT